MGNCNGLYVSDGEGFDFVDPNYVWLPVELPPHLPLCHTFIRTARNVSLTTSLVAPLSNQQVTGSHVVVKATTSGVGISTVSIVLTGVGKSVLSGKLLGTAKRSHSAWSLVWDSRSQPNGVYVLRSVARNTVGSSAASSGVTVTVDNSANGS